MGNGPDSRPEQGPYDYTSIRESNARDKSYFMLDGKISAQFWLK